MANFKGFKQVLFADFEALSGDEKKGYMWFVRESAESKNGSIYFGSRLYANCSADVDLSGFYSKEEVNDLLDAKADVNEVNAISALVLEVMNLIGLTVSEDSISLVLSEAFDGAQNVVAALEVLADRLAEHERVAGERLSDVEGKLSNLVIGTEEREGVTFVQLKSGNEVVSEFDASQFVVDGMLSGARLEGTNLVLTFNTDAGQEDITVDLSGMIKSYAFDAAQFVVNGTDVALNEEYIKGLIAAAQSGITVVKGNGIEVNYATDEEGSAVVTVSAKVAEDVEGNFLAVGENGLYAVLSVSGNDVE